MFPCWYTTDPVQSTEVHGPSSDRVHLRSPQGRVGEVVRGAEPVREGQRGRGPRLDDGPGAAGARDVVPYTGAMPLPRTPVD